MPKNAPSKQPHASLYSDVAIECLYAHLRLHLGHHFRVLRSILTPAIGGVRRIDLLVLGPSRIFLVSATGLDGVYLGSARSRQWTCELDNGEIVAFPNPLRESPRQIKCLSSDLSVVPKESFRALVSFPDFATFDGLHSSSCLYGSELVQYIIDHSSEQVFTQLQIQAFMERLESTSSYLRSAYSLRHV